MFKSVFAKYISAFMFIIFISFIVLVLIITSMVNSYAVNAKEAVLSRAASINSGKPATVLWSHRATAVTPACCAACSSCAGVREPSEQLEWVCRSTIFFPFYAGTTPDRITFCQG